MASSIRDNTKRTRALQTGTLVGVRLQPDGLAALDAFIAHSPEQAYTRPEAIRALMEQALKAKAKKKPGATRLSPAAAGAPPRLHGNRAG